MARQLIEALSGHFEPERYHDEYREQLLELIDRKAAGEEIVAEPTVEEPGKVVDLMAALEASLARAGSPPPARPANTTASPRSEPADAARVPQVRLTSTTTWSAVSAARTERKGEATRRVPGAWAFRRPTPAGERRLLGRVVVHRPAARRAEGPVLGATNLEARLPAHQAGRLVVGGHDASDVCPWPSSLE